MARFRILETSTGPFFLLACNDGSLETGWVEMAQNMGRMNSDGLAEATLDKSMLPDVVSRILMAFNGQSVDFSDLPTPSGTPFQRAVWRATRAIPLGETRSYAETAAAAGYSGAARAVGQAMRKNRLPMIIPCHRVVGATGLGGFGGKNGLGGWILIKKALLDAEKTDSQPKREMSTLSGSM